MRLGIYNSLGHVCRLSLHINLILMQTKLVFSVTLRETVLAFFK